MVVLWRKNGFTLIELMVAVFIFGTISAVIYHQLADSIKIAESLDIDADLLALREIMAQKVNCAKTLPIAPEEGVAVTLLDRSGKSVFSANNLGAPFDTAAGVYGDYYIATTWTGKSIATAVAKKAPFSMTFAKDPLTKVEINFSNPRMQIFGDPPSFTPLCPLGGGDERRSKLERTRVREINRVLGNPLTWTANENKRYISLLQRGCHEYCKSLNYTAGYYKASTDQDANGNNLPPGLGQVGCACLY